MFDKILNQLSRLKKSVNSLKGKMGRPDEEEILEGNIIKVMFQLGWPIMVATFLRTLYNLADTVWLGRLPAEEATYSVAAASQAWSVVFIVMSIEIGFGVAALAIISQYVGAGNKKKASEYAGQLYLIVILLSIILAVIGYFGTPYLLEVLTGAGPEAEALARYGTEYLQITFLGMPFMFLFFAFMFILRGVGDNITPMKIVGVTAILNIIIDPFLILGSGHVLSIGSLEFAIPTIFGYEIPKLGIEGAAIATVVTRGLGALYSVYLMFTGKVGLKVKLSYLIPDIEKIKEYLRIGLPAAIGRFGESLGFLILWAVVYRLPNPEVAGAAYGAGNKILNITFLVIGGVTMAMSTMVGQGLGADKVERVEEVTKKGLIALVGLGSLIAVAIYFARGPLISFIVPADPEVIEAGKEFLRIFSLSLPFFCVFRGVTKTLAGAGHTYKQMGLNLIRIWGFRLVFVFLFALALGMGDLGVWAGLALSNFASSIAAMFVYSRGSWKEKVIKGPSPETKVPVDDESQEA